MKYAWIAAQGKAYALAEACSVLDVSISGYRAWKRGGKPDRKRLTDTQTLAVIRAIHVELKGAYGSPRMGRCCESPLKSKIMLMNELYLIAHEHFFQNRASRRTAVRPVSWPAD